MVCIMRAPVAAGLAADVEAMAAVRRRTIAAALCRERDDERAQVAHTDRCACADAAVENAARQEHTAHAAAEEKAEADGAAATAAAAADSAPPTAAAAAVRMPALWRVNALSILQSARVLCVALLSAALVAALLGCCGRDQRSAQPPTQTHQQGPRTDMDMHTGRTSSGWTVQCMCREEMAVVPCCCLPFWG
jgi:hypothetical protein